jgi:hypothetical protein
MLRRHKKPSRLLTILACMTLLVSIRCSESDPAPVVPTNTQEQGVDMGDAAASFDAPKTRTGTGWNIRSNTKI